MAQRKHPSAVVVGVLLGRDGGCGAKKKVASLEAAIFLQGPILRPARAKPVPLGRSQRSRRKWAPPSGHVSERWARAML